jgi:hypothetical protein
VRLCEAILAALALSGGWLSRAQVRDGLGQGPVDPLDMDAALDDLLDRELIVAKKRRKGVGRHGRPRTVYASITARLVLASDGADPVVMSPTIELELASRLALLDYAQARFLAARASAESSLEDEQLWLRASLALGAELYPDEPVAVDGRA